jgi:hypothetical protein
MSFPYQEAFWGLFLGASLRKEAQKPSLSPLFRENKLIIALS